MGQQFLAYVVEVLDDVHHGTHRVADFSRLQPAIRAAKLALNDSRVRITVVKNRDGRMVYCADNRREWTETPDIPSHDPAETAVFDSSGTGQPEPDDPADLTAYRRHGIALLILYLAAAWIEVPPL